MSYLTNKPGSLEEVVKGLTKNINDSAYQDLFKKELEKTGKGLGAMSNLEKTAFFNKIDKMHKGKNESVEETHVGQTKKANQSQKDTGGEKEVVKPISVRETILNMWKEVLPESTSGQTSDETPEEKKENKDKMKKKEADTGTAATKVETEPKIDYEK